MTLRAAAVKIVAQLIKDGAVIGTYSFDVPTPDDLDAFNRAFTYFRDRHPHMTVETDDVRIEFRDESGELPN
jgi:hypothetical protein